jgi:hypothetical protein
MMARILKTVLQSLATLALILIAIGNAAGGHWIDAAVIMIAAIVLSL